MDILIRSKPVFVLPLTKQQIDALIELSRSHYDYKCKEASSKDGFLTRWSKLMEFHISYLKLVSDTEKNTVPFTVDASFNELDLSLKILEMSGYLRDESLVMVCQAMARSFSGAAHLANSKFSEWQVTYKIS